MRLCYFLEFITLTMGLDFACNQFSGCFGRLFALTAFWIGVMCVLCLDCWLAVMSCWFGRFIALLLVILV